MRSLRGAAVLFATAAIWAQAPAPDDRISPGDLVYLEVYRVPEMTSSFQVNASGQIDLPYVDPVKIAGMTETEAAAAVSESLRSILRSPRVTVSRSGVRMGETIGRTPEMKMELIPLQNASAESLSGVLQGMSSAGGTISSDPDTNTLIVTDTPDAIVNITNAVMRLDQMQSQLTQVRIEAKIAEVRVGALKELGIRWWAKGKEGIGGFYPLPAQDPSLNAARGGISPFSGEQIGGNNSSSNGTGNSSGGRSFVDQPFDRRLNVPVQVPLPGQSFFGFANAHIDIGAMLDALVQDNNAELLANPMTLTVNHKTASIRMTDEFPYTEFGTEITGATNFSTKFMDLGIVLDVTPHVYRDTVGAYVKLEVRPEVSFPIGSSNGVPIRSVRRSETIANVRDGQTLVIGGIMREDERILESKVPGLGKIPLLGNLFKHKENTKIRTELMIFVTPSVHDRPEEITWDKMIDVSDKLREQDLIPLAEIRGEKRKD